RGSCAERRGRAAGRAGEGRGQPCSHPIRDDEDHARRVRGTGGGHVAWVLVSSSSPRSLVDVRPAVGRDRLLADLVPPRHFAEATFASYVPDPAHPSQQRALQRLAEVAEALAPSRGFGSWL